MRKVRRGKISFDKDQLVKDVLQAWEDYDLGTLADMWEYLQYCLKAAVEVKGGNNYPRHRPKEERPKKKARKL